jgi:hypothetical protein
MNPTGISYNGAEKMSDLELEFKGMNIEILALCDAATDQHGKLNILGAFDAIFVKDLPFTHPHCAVALRMRFQRIDWGKHKVNIHLIDSDGRFVVPSIDADINIQGQQDKDSLAVNLVINLQNLKFEKYGQYAVNLAVDGRQQASIPLYINQPQQK